MIDGSDVALGLDRATPRFASARRWGFYGVLALSLVMLALPMAPFLVIPLIWPFLGEQLGVHQVHDIAVSATLWLMVAGLLAQIRRPETQVGAMQQVLLFIITFIGVTAIGRPGTLLTPSPILLSFTLPFVVAALHPARGEIARLKLRADRYLAGLALLAAGPLLLYARGQVRLDHSALPLAAHGGHWTTMAGLATAIVVLALLGATRPRGWRIPVWSAGGAAFLLGISSTALPHMPSSIGPGWGLLTAAWSVIFIGMAEVRYRGLTDQAALVR